MDTDSTPDTETGTDTDTEPSNGADGVDGADGADGAPDLADPADPAGSGSVTSRASAFGPAKWAVLGLAMVFLVGAAGYFVGVRTASPPTSAVDEGFLQDMSDHHDQAVRIAQAELTHGSDPVVRDFAMEVLLFQRRELGIMQTYQQERGILAADYDPERLTMAWMDMPRPLSAMNGMATPEQLADLDAARGVDADKLFLQLMMEHHRGGVHMATYAADHAADQKIVVLAQRMARNQAAEIDEYQVVLDRLEAA